MTINKANLIVKYSAPADISYSGRKKIGKIRCTACGKYISSDGGLDDVEVSVTKRGSLIVFHTKCADQVWNTRMK